MLSKEDFENQAYKDNIMKIHTLVSLSLFKLRNKSKAWYHLQNGDQRWLNQERAKEVLRVLDALDFSLDHGNLDLYLEQHAILWELLEELELDLLIRKKIAKQFGADCFFITLKTYQVV